VIGDKYTICDPYLFTIASQVKVTLSQRQTDPLITIARPCFGSIDVARSMA